MLFEPYICFHIFSYVRVAEWPPAGEKLLTQLMIYFSWYKYLSVILIFSRPQFVEWEFLSDCAIS